MDKYNIHKFNQKLLQKSVFPNLKEYILWRQGKKKIDSRNFPPISINLDLTTGCNFRCDHCIDADIINKGTMLDFQYVKKLLIDWSKKGLRSVILIGGGEPTLYPLFEDVIKLLKDLSMQIGIVSNGTRMERISNIASLLNNRDWVRLSVDAGTNETFGRMHNPVAKVALDKITSDVKELRQKESRFQMGYSFLIIGDNKQSNGKKLVNNIKEISLAAKLAKDNGFSYLSLKPFISPEGERETMISKKNLAEIKKEIKKARKFEEDGFKVIESINLFCFYDKQLKEIMQKQPRCCHSQFFRSVVIPAGICNCSLWRGFSNTKIIDANRKIAPKYYKELEKGRLEMIDSFNAKEICNKVSCLYAPLNCWIEELIQNPEELAKIKPIKDFNDFFF